MFNEDNTVEQMIISTLSKNGWKYVAPEQLQRSLNDVMVESMVVEAIKRLNPDVITDDSKVDIIMQKLRALVLTANEHNLVETNENFKKLVFENNSYPVGENSKQESVDLFGTALNGKLDKNEYCFTNQWVYPAGEGGKRFDIVLLINGFPIAIGELKTPVRAAVTWLDGAQDIASYEKSVAPMFAFNVFNFATEGKCYRYGSVNMPPSKWGPWHTPEDKSEKGYVELFLIYREGKK